MILNIIDRRKNVYRWKRIDVTIEATWHDNAFEDSDYALHDHREPSYATRNSISLTDAVTWASSFEVPLTLFLYDNGNNGEPEWEVVAEEV